MPKPQSESIPALHPSVPQDDDFDSHTAPSLLAEDFSSDSLDSGPFTSVEQMGGEIAPQEYV